MVCRRGRGRCPDGLALRFACRPLSRGHRCDQEIRRDAGGGVNPPLTCRLKSGQLPNWNVNDSIRRPQDLLQFLVQLKSDIPPNPNPNIWW